MRGLHKQDMEILELAEGYPQGLFLRQIKEYLKITSMQNAYARCAKLCRKGYMVKEDRLYRLTMQGQEAVKRFSRMSDHSFERQQVAGIPARVHAWGLAYALKDALPPAEPPRIFQLAGFSTKPISMNNNMQAQAAVGGITARLTTRELILYTKDIYTDSRTESIDLEAMLKPDFDRLARTLEKECQKVAQFKLKELSRGILASHIVRQHYAEERHPAAEAARSSPLILAKSPIDGQKRLGIDMSKGFREWEYYHHITADTDKDTLDRQFNAVLDGEVSLLDINRSRNIIMQQQERYDRQFDIVDRLTKQVELHLKLMQKIDRRLSQRQLNE